MSDFKALWEYASSPNFKELTGFLKVVTNCIAAIALYVTIALALALVVWAIVIRNKNEQQLAAARKVMVGIIIGYSVAVIGTIGSLRLLRDVLKGDVTETFWLVVGLFALLAVGVAVTLTLQKKRIACYKWVALGFVVAFVAYAVVMLCVVQPSEGYSPLSNWQMYLFSALVVAAIALLALFGGKSGAYNTKALTYAAICIALSFALSYVKFFSLPQGGSVTFASLLPLALYSYMFGTRKGVVAGVVYGLLQFIQSPQFYQPMQVLLDYPIAFGAIGVAGVGRKFKFLRGNMQAEFAVGATIAVLLRYVSHVLSGYYVFYTWAGDSHPLAYSLVYNLFTLVDLAIVLVMGVAALSAKSFRRVVLGAAAEDFDKQETPVLAEETPTDAQSECCDE